MDILILEYEEILKQGFCTEEELVARICALYHSIVHEIDPGVYSVEDQMAWSPEPPAVSDWIERFREAPPALAFLASASSALPFSNDTSHAASMEHPRAPFELAATRASEPVADRGSAAPWLSHLLGFMNLEMDGAGESKPGCGHIDLAYVSTKHQRKGISQRLYSHLEKQARERGLLSLTVDASHLARPFFEKQGFQFRTENQVPRNGRWITNFTLEKVFSLLQYPPNTSGN